MSTNWAKLIIGDSRKIPEIEDRSVDLVITSPPYWHIKDYGVTGQAGYNQSLHDYLLDLYHVWKEMDRVLKPGSRLCINIGDQFLRSAVYGRYRIVPLHAEIISQCEQIGFDYMGSIIWQKKTTINTTGGATVMGSFPYPRNGILEIDYEFILIFRKRGKQQVDRTRKAASALSKEEWKEYFSSHWNFSGERQTEHEAMFPLELPKRLVRMFSLVGDTVLDPFAGSGTTAQAALENHRNTVACEINEDYLPIIQKKTGIQEASEQKKFECVVIHRDTPINIEPVDYKPSIQDAVPKINPAEFSSSEKKLTKVLEIIDGHSLRVEPGLTVNIAGIKLTDEDGAETYLKKYIKGKQVFLVSSPGNDSKKDSISAYVYLKNRIFVNRELIKRGCAQPLQDDEMLSRVKLTQSHKD